MSAKIFLLLNPANFVLTFEIRTVDRSGIPTETILGTTTALMGPPMDFTNPPSPPRKVTATLSPPVPVTLGQRYALTLTAPSFQYLLHANTEGNACPDGSLFGDNSATGDFIVLPEVDADLVYAVSIL